VGQRRTSEFLPMRTRLRSPLFGRGGAHALPVLQA